MYSVIYLGMFSFINMGSTMIFITVGYFYFPSIIISVVWVSVSYIDLT